MLIGKACRAAEWKTESWVVKSYAMHLIFFFPLWAKGERKFTLGEKHKSERDFPLVGGIGLAARIRGSGIDQSPSNSVGVWESLT